MVALMTMSVVLLPVVAVSAVLAWAESRAHRRDTAVREPPLTGAFLATREDEGSREATDANIRERLLRCHDGGGYAAHPAGAKAPEVVRPPDQL
jgi:hypothetical protein